MLKNYGVREIGRINDNGDLGQRRNRFLDQLDALGADLGQEKGQSGQIPAGTGETGHEPDVDGIGHSAHHNWNGRGGLLGCSCAGCAMGYEHIDVEVYQFGCQFGEAVVSALGPPILEDNVVALLVSELAKTRSQGVELASVFRARRHAQKADPVNLPRWLRARHEWPSDRRAAEKCDELAPLHVPSAGTAPLCRT